MVALIVLEFAVTAAGTDGAAVGPKVLIVGLFAVGPLGKFAFCPDQSSYTRSVLLSGIAKSDLMLL